MKFYSKALTLKKIKVKNAIIPKLIIINFNDYYKNPQKVNQLIYKTFKNKKVAIRSSFKAEDTNAGTNAGKFKSFLNIKSDDFNKIKNCINEIKFSNKKIKRNEIFFIQEMVPDVSISGVVFTKKVLSYLKCLQINYSLGKNTSKVTSGLGESFTLTYFKNNKYKIPKKFLKLEKLTDELTSCFDKDNLDIEFAINNKGQVYLLQVRPLIQKKIKTISDRSQKNILINLEKKIKKLKKKHYTLYGDTTFFGNMPDWNPAEIIGIKPKPLSLSLYQELITDHIWAKNRKNYGYKNLEQFHLMTTFYGTPFVDIRVDFNSWIPGDLSDNISKKLCNYYLNKFKQNKNLQDKIEFDLLFTCATFSNKKLIEKNLKKILSKNDRVKFFNSLKKINSNLIKNFNIDKSKLETLQERQSKVEKSDLYFIDKIYWLVEDCKKFGTLPFAGLARCGFVAIEILNSLLNENYITKKERDRFMENINTIMTEMKKDFLKFSKKDFLKKYGHLRPNTYEITNKNYKENFNVYFKGYQKKHLQIKEFKNTISLKYLKKPNIKKIGFDCNIEDLEKFIRESIIYREFSKFLFSKNIDLIFNNLIKFGKKYQISRDDLSYIKISKILNMYFNITNFDAIKNLKIHIKENKMEFKLNENIVLPDVINKPRDLYIQYHKPDKLNFISNKKIISKIIPYNENKSHNNLNGIVCIENADPGYDFLFGRNIKGLITKYGGINSHMAIRCAELNLPAIIGVGKKNYETILNQNTIEIDCLSKKINFVG